MHIPKFLFVSLAYFDIQYPISISLRKYKMSKRNLFEELKNGLEDATLYEKSLHLKPPLSHTKSVHYSMQKRYTL